MLVVPHNAARLDRCGSDSMPRFAAPGAEQQPEGDGGAGRHTHLVALCALSFGQQRWAGHQSLLEADGAPVGLCDACEGCLRHTGAPGAPSPSCSHVASVGGEVDVASADRGKQTKEGIRTTHLCLHVPCQRGQHLHTARRCASRATRVRARIRAHKAMLAVPEVVRAVEASACIVVINAGRRSPDWQSQITL